MSHAYPFTAYLGGDPDAHEGLDDMALALVLTTVSPAIGGVLIRGEKGTAKSTLVRALAGVLPPIDVFDNDRFSVDPHDALASSPDGPFEDGRPVHSRPVRLVELPVGASEDRVAGSLHLESALSAGTVEFEPGLLAQAHRGILYVDEVNLLHDHLVDLLLDAAAMGRLTVERDSVSVTHAARFVLVGTMNPEEGELRPQLLDRFGLTVEVAAPREPALRAEVVRRRLTFDDAPAEFVARYADAQTRLQTRIVEAQLLAPRVRLDDDTLLLITEVCSAFEVDGLRADIVMARTATAHAAWEGRDTVSPGDVRVAARLALPHRRRRNPFDAPGIDDQTLDELLPPDGPADPAPSDHGTGSRLDTDPDGGPDSDGPDPDGPGPDGPGPDGPGSGAPSDDERNSTQNPGTSGTSVPSSTNDRDTYRTREFTVAGIGDGTGGRRSRARSASGRRLAATRSGDGHGIDLVATLRAAAVHQQARGRTTGRVLLRSNDLRRAVREDREANLVVFVVDTSGSMAARDRVRQVRAAAQSLLLDAYQRRDRVALIAFRAHSADVVLPSTASVDVAVRRLEDLPTGGRTPLAEGLVTAADFVRREGVRDPGRRALVLVISDGRATAGPDAVGRSLQAAELLARTDATIVVVDCETSRMRLGLARTLAGHAGADYVPLSNVSADALTTIVHEAA